MAHPGRHGLSLPRSRTPRQSVPGFGTAKPGAKALQVAERIWFPLGDRDVVNSEELVEPTVGEFGSELVPE